MREIFSNAGVTRLSQSLTTSELVLTVEDTSSFPTPTVGAEYFNLTVSGACDTRVEIMRIVEVCGPTCLRADIRGHDGTTAQTFVPGDMAYNSITGATAQAILDRFQWYLGPFDYYPASDNEGDPLQDGHIFWNTTEKFMYVWNDTVGQWVPFNPTLTTSYIESFTFNPTGSALPADTNLTFPDIYGNSPGDWVLGTHLIECYKNGIRQIEEIDDLVLDGGFVVDYANNTVAPTAEIEIGATWTIVVGERADAQSLAAYIQRTETTTADFDFVVDEDDMVSDLETQVPTQQSVKAYADTKMVFAGTWTAGTYEPHRLVIDGQYAAVSLVSTSDRPVPQPTGNAEYGVDGETFTGHITTGAAVVAGNVFTTNTPGSVDLVKIFGMDTGGSITSYNVRIEDITSGTTTLYQSANITSISATVVEFSIPKIFIDTARNIRITMHIAGTAIEVEREVGFWTGTTNDPSWSSASEGYISVDGVPDAGQTDNSFGVDLQFTPTEAQSGDWALLPSGGGGGAGSVGSADSVNHLIGDSQPTSGVGSDGDIYFVREQ